MEHRQFWCILAAVVTMILLCLSGAAYGEEPNGASLQSRIEQLEKQMANLKKEASAAAQQAPATPAAPAAPAAAPQEPSAMKNVWSNLDIQLYGYVKGDASYDSSRTTAGNYVLYVDSEATRDNDDEFNLTANQTRLGFNINGPASETMKA